MMYFQVAQIVPVTEAEGPGRRFALWFQGCPLRCPGCCNPEMLPFTGGTPPPIAEVVAAVADGPGWSVAGGAGRGGGGPGPRRRRRDHPVGRRAVGPCRRRRRPRSQCPRRR